MNDLPSKTAYEFDQSSITGRILIVDDQSTNIQVVGTALGRLGHDIIPALNGPTALKRLSLSPPDLILLDVLMPDMDGYEVCRRIRENPAWNDVPIIFLSAADDKGFIVRALEAGGVDYITKPFNQAELICRVRTQLSLKAARDRLKILAEDKDELLGIMAHDCKNQLGGLHMTAQLLLETARQNGHEHMTHLAENIEHNSGQLLLFVKEFLSNAMTEHSLELEKQPFRLQDVVNQVAREYQRKAERKNLPFHVESPPENAMIEADPKAVRQILENLVSNAIKFSQPQAPVTLSVEEKEGRVICTVADKGPGFTEKDQKRMFQRYARLSARPTGGEPSTGLGLSIVKKLVDAMGGTLTCQSKPGQGARFSFSFPTLSVNTTHLNQSK